MVLKDLVYPLVGLEEEVSLWVISHLKALNKYLITFSKKSIFIILGVVLEVYFLMIKMIILLIRFSKMKTEDSLIKTLYLIKIILNL